MHRHRELKGVTVICLLRAMTSDAEDCTYVIRGVPEEKRVLVQEALCGVDGLDRIRPWTCDSDDDPRYIRVECGDILIGVKDGTFHNPDDTLPGVRAAVRKCVGKMKVRAYTLMLDKGRSTAELIWGPDWQDRIALTEEEMEVLGR